MKLVALFAAMLAVLFGGLAHWLPARLAAQSRALVEDDALELARLAARAAQPAVEFDDRTSAVAVLQALARSRGAAYAVLLHADGTELAASRPPGAAVPRPRGGGEQRRVGGTLLHVEVPVAVRAGPPGVLLVGFDLRELAERQREARAAVAIACLAVLAVGIAATLAMATVLVRPLRDIVAVAQRVAHGDAAAAQELPVGRPDEVGAVSRSLAFMLDRLYEQRAEVDALNAELERRVGDRTAALERANAQLAERLAELKRTQEQLIVADRRVSVGRLAAGVAHEVNNPLAFMDANLRFAAEELPDVARLARAGGGPALDALVAEIGEALAESRQGADRVAHIVRGLKTFARTDEDRREPIEVRAALEAALDMSLHEIKHRARVVRALGAAPLVLGNEVRLSQVFLNLLLNAAQAIPEDAADRNEIRVTLGTDGRGWATVAVRDTGVGIPAENLSRIFDPFFTTKPVGVGTGLGLSISQGIVLAMGGEISVDSAPGAGTTVTVALPPTALAPAAREAAPAPDDGRPRTLLVVDDEPLVAAAVRRALSRRHQVSVATSGRQALELIRRGAVFDHILCDVMMPEMTGLELHAELSRVAPEQAAAMTFMTGGAFGTAAREFLAARPGAWLAKPLDPAALRRILHE